jgi:multidrug efflux pump subunit AcrA (membrane-fusion protein)
MKKKIILILAVLIVIAGAFFIINSKKSKKTEAREVIVKNMEIGTFIDSIDIEGNIEIKNQKDIYISKSQRVVDVLVEEGDEVKKGAILITFDPDERAAIERDIKSKEIEIEKEKINIKSYSLKISNL